MLEFSKQILRKVSFDKLLFKKELKKSIRWIKMKVLVSLDIWALITFSQQKEIIIDGLDWLT